MKGIAAVAAVGSLLATTVQAQDGVRFDIKRRQHNVLPRVARRSESTLPVSLANNVENGAYFVDVSMGTPPQNLSLQLDTGSSDTWAPLTSASICQQSAGNPQGCSFGACMHIPLFFKKNPNLMASLRAHVLMCYIC
jgi:hypothetical protein